MRVDAIDPQLSTEAVDFPVTQDLFYRAYYEPSSQQSGSGTEMRKAIEYVSADLGVLGVRVGLLRDIYEFMTSREGVP
jgi:hypothetical protein